MKAKELINVLVSTVSSSTKGQPPSERIDFDNRMRRVVNAILNCKITDKDVGKTIASLDINIDWD